MDWLVDASWREYPGAVLMAVGGLLALMGARRQTDGILRPIGDPAKALTWMRGFRQTVLGLAVLGTAAAWLWQAPWLLALSLIIGAGELFESSLDVWALTKGKPAARPSHFEAIATRLQLETRKNPAFAGKLSASATTHRRKGGP